ncbi:MAG TPA: hypothetical protein VFC24_11480 [Casimicrobiaceae bacterium]|nr:hypothetical protein [Casimicrobiaceae bacterium]
MNRSLHDRSSEPESFPCWTAADVLHTLTRPSAAAMLPLARGVLQVLAGILIALVFVAAPLLAGPIDPAL